MELIGEEAWQLLKAGVDLGEEVPLAQIANMRHRMVHAYEGVDWSVVEEAASMKSSKELYPWTVAALAYPVDRIAEVACDHKPGS